MKILRGYKFHPEAENDLIDIWEYIAADSADSADQLTDRIVSRLDNLVKFPNQGHRRSDITSRPLRFVLVDDYLIAYAPDVQPLWVVAILHGRRDPRVMAAILRSREESPQ